MSKQLLTRYIWLVDTIYQAGYEGITLSEISDKWRNNVRMSKGDFYNWRTFMRHKNDVLELFGVDIGCHKSNNAYYIVERGDLSDSSGFRRWLIETLPVNNRLNESAQLKDRILLETNPSGGIRTGAVPATRWNIPYSPAVKSSGTTTTTGTANGRKASR